MEIDGFFECADGSWYKKRCATEVYKNEENRFFAIVSASGYATELFDYKDLDCRDKAEELLGAKRLAQIVLVCLVEDLSAVDCSHSYAHFVRTVNDVVMSSVERAKLLIVKDLGDNQSDQ